MTAHLRLSWLNLFSILALLCGAALTNPARAASAVTAAGGCSSAINSAGSSAITVANNNDSGPGSLRQAITDLCPGGTISFNADQSITLTSGELAIGKNMTIDGGNHKIVIDGNNASRVFNISASAIALKHLTIQHGVGDYGAGIYSAGDSLTITNSTLADNSASGMGGGIYSVSPLTITGSTFSSNSAGMGGGIYSSSLLTTTGSTFSGNSASTGGAIDDEGPMTVTNNTFSGNSASTGGGGINIDNRATAAVINSTFSDNSAGAIGGAIASLPGTHTTLRNTLLANSTQTTSSPVTPGNNCGGSISDGGNNLDTGTSCGFSAATSLRNSDPKLAPLADNGGPTETFALPADSPAFNAGNDSVCADAATVNNLDQRGVVRPQGAHCDIGAFELDTTKPTVNSFTATSPTNLLDIPITAFTASDNVGVTGYIVTESNTPPAPTAAGWSADAPGSYTVPSTGTYNLYPWARDYDGNVSNAHAPSVVLVCTSLAITVANNNDSGPGSLRQAIADLCPGGTISFDADQTITLTSGQLSIGKDLTIDGGDHKIVLDGNTASRVLNISEGTIALKKLTIQHGASDNGAGIHITGGSLTITSSTLAGNTVTDRGGAIYGEYASLTIANSTLTGNSAGNGGAIFTIGSTANITNTTFSGNSASLGGAMYIENTQGSANSTTFSGNSADMGGGILFDYFVNFPLTGSLFAGNTPQSCRYQGPPISFTDGGHNMQDDDTCIFTADTSISGSDPKLGSLADNGGPTQTMALPSDSPAYNAGGDTCPATDQRGVARPQGAHCDIGAFELDTTKPTVDSFTATSPTSLLDIPITAFTASDNLGVTGYLVTESNTPPAPTAAGWSADAPDSYTVPSTGTYHLYPWAKDYDGNVSNAHAPSVVLVCTSLAITVANNNDSGAGSLRQAIADLCPGGTISFDADRSITLTSGELAIGKDLTIDGGDHKIVLDGNSASRVFNISAGTIALKHLTIQHGASDDGAGIYSAGTSLTITSSTLAGNSATNKGGGIYAKSMLTITNSTFSRNSAAAEGGAFYISTYTVNVTNSTFSGNSAKWGGVLSIIASPGGITNSTFSGNSTTQTGNLLFSTPTVVKFTNNLLAGNTGNNCWFAVSPIGGYDKGYNLEDDESCLFDAGTSRNNTDTKLGPLADNGGPTQTMALPADSPAVNTGGDTCPATDQRGVTRPQGAHCDIGAFELDTTKPTVDSFTATSPTALLDIPVTAFTASDNVGVTGYIVTESATPPALADTGWSNSAPGSYTVPSTGTYNLYPWARDNDGNISEIPTPVVVNVCTSSAITIANNTDSGAGSLRQALMDLCPGGTISFDADLSITLTSGELAIGKDLTIDGGNHKIVIDGNNSSRIFKIAKSQVVSLKGLTLQKGKVIRPGAPTGTAPTPGLPESINWSGGAILNYGTLTLTNSTLSNNLTNDEGGAILNVGSLTATNDTFTGNSAKVGGGIDNYGTGVISYSSIVGNSSQTDGGGISSYSSLTADHTLISSNAPGNCTGSVTDGGYNLEDGASCGFTAGTSLSSTNPNIGPLADNGGPTQTMALPAGSPAVNAGGDTCPATDQRGVTRPQGAHCDIGAFEYVSPAAVSINQAAGQSDPTASSPINFTVIFARDMTGFTASDVSLGGTAGATTAVVSGGPATYNVAVSGMTTDGTVTASLPAGAATDAFFTGSAASTSTDNSVTYHASKLTVSIDQAAGQSDPATGSPINFTVIFNTPVTGFGPEDISLGGTAGASKVKITPVNITAPVPPGPIPPAPAMRYNVAVSGMLRVGTVIPSIPAGGVKDGSGNLNEASTSTDNTVTYNPYPVIKEGSKIEVDLDENGSPKPFALTLHASSLAGYPLTWSLKTPPVFGTAGINPASGVVFYIPFINFSGEEDFVAQVADDHGGSATITITADVHAVPYKGPLLLDQAYGIQYDGWLGISDTHAYGGAYRKAVSGDFIFKPTQTFTAFTWLTYRGPDQGKAQILVDGALKATVDLYSPTPQWQYLVTVSGLASKAHTVIIRATNTRNSSSSANWVTVDGFKVGSATYDDNNTTAGLMTFNTWAEMASSSARYGNYHLSSTANATLGLEFDGTSLQWDTATGPNYGLADIYIDGVLVKEVDLYSSAQNWQFKVLINKLTYGHHTVTIKVLGKKNATSKGTGVVSDGFEIN